MYKNESVKKQVFENQKQILERKQDEVSELKKKMEYQDKHYKLVLQVASEENGENKEPGPCAAFFRKTVCK